MEVVDPIIDIRPLVVRAAYDAGFAAGQSEIRVETSRYIRDREIYIRLYLDDLIVQRVYIGLKWGMFTTHLDSIVTNSRASFKTIDEVIEFLFERCSYRLHHHIRAIADMDMFKNVKFISASDCVSGNPLTYTHPEPMAPPDW